MGKDVHVSRKAIESAGSVPCNKLRLPVASPRGAHVGPFGPTSYYNDISQ